MTRLKRSLVIVVRPGTRGGRVLRWLRHLLPAAILLTSPPTVSLERWVDIVNLDEDEVASGPLSLADALLRHRNPPPGGSP